MVRTKSKNWKIMVVIDTLNKRLTPKKKIMVAGQTFMNIASFKKIEYTHKTILLLPPLPPKKIVS